MQTARLWIELVDAPIDLLVLCDKLADPDVGAHGWFLGVTRRTTGGKRTTRLSYQAHRSMAIRELEKLAAAAIEQFSLRAVVLVHRLGEVPVGEASVVVGCSSGHRAATFQALPWIMDRLKQNVPIWKQEHYADGTTEWVHPQAEGAAAGETCR
jgi:molybdopterin synthase catalytic subunit